MMCCGHSHTRTYYQKKSICFSIHSSFFLSHICFFFLALFFRLFLVLLSSSSLSFLSLFVDIRTAILFFCLCHALALYMRVCECSKKKKNRRTINGTRQRSEMLVSMCAHANRLYFLSLYDKDKDAENARTRHCCRSTSK